jgi:hypothetical protein
MAGYEAAIQRLHETRALVSSQVVEAAEMAAARFATLDTAQEAVRQAEEMYRKFREASFGMVGPKGQFDALEPLTAVQALNVARMQYLAQVIDFNRSQFRLYMAIGQPAQCGIDTSTPHGVTTPVIPNPLGTTGHQPLPDPRSIPTAPKNPN